MSHLMGARGKSSVGKELHNQSQRFVNAMKGAFEVDIHTHTHLH